MELSRDDYIDCQDAADRDQEVDPMDDEPKERIPLKFSAAEKKVFRSLLDKRPLGVQLAEAEAKAVDPTEHPNRRYVWTAMVEALKRDIAKKGSSWQRGES
jgi:hypothetical protein